MMDRDVQNERDRANHHGDGGAWTFLTNHGHVIICLTRQPDARLRDVADQVGITERAVQRIVSDLEEGGFLTRNRDGRRNHYVIHGDRALRHPVEAGNTVGALLATVGASSENSDDHDNER